MGGAPQSEFEQALRAEAFERALRSPDAWTSYKVPQLPPIAARSTARSRPHAPQILLQSLERKSVEASPFLRRSQIFRVIKSRFKAGWDQQMGASVVNDMRAEQKVLTALEVRAAGRTRSRS
jgi:hypothetical protein